MDSSGEGLAWGYPQNGHSTLGTLGQVLEQVRLSRKARQNRCEKYEPGQNQTHENASQERQKIWKIIF